MDLATSVLRFLLPITMGVFLYAYNQDMNRINEKLTDIKAELISMKSDSKEQDDTLSMVKYQCCSELKNN